MRVSRRRVFVDGSVEFKIGRDRIDVRLKEFGLPTRGRSDPAEPHFKLKPRIERASVRNFRGHAPCIDRVAETRRDERELLCSRRKMAK